MFTILDIAKMAGAAALAGLIAYHAGHWRGEDAGYDRRVAEVAVQDAKAEAQRRGDDATIQGMSDYDLCVIGLRGSGMPVDACEQLRGVSQE